MIYSERRVRIPAFEKIDATKCASSIDRSSQWSRPVSLTPRRGQAGQKLMDWKLPTIARVVNGWSMNTDTMGVYGNYYLKRAIVTRLGLGANLPEDAIYPLNLTDEAGKPLDGSKVYHPLRQGIDTAGECFLVHHHVRSRGERLSQQSRPASCKFMDALRVQCRRVAGPLFPEREPRQEQGGQLVTVTEGGFNLTMRMYSPKAEALTGRWNPPPIVKSPDAIALSAQ